MTTEELLERRRQMLIWILQIQNDPRYAGCDFGITEYSGGGNNTTQGIFCVITKSIPVQCTQITVSGSINGMCIRLGSLYSPAATGGLDTFDLTYYTGVDTVTMCFDSELAYTEDPSLYIKDDTNNTIIWGTGYVEPH